MLPLRRVSGVLDENLDVVDLHTALETPRTRNEREGEFVLSALRPNIFEDVLQPQMTV